MFDDYPHEINLTYLHHDTLTDIITFDNAEEEQILKATFFISIDWSAKMQIQLNFSFFKDSNQRTDTRCFAFLY